MSLNWGFCILLENFCNCGEIRMVSHYLRILENVTQQADQQWNHNFMGKRTQRDLMDAILTELGQEHGQELREAFAKDFLGGTPGPGTNQTMSEAEYQSALTQIRKEMPKFRAWLLSRDRTN